MRVFISTLRPDHHLRPLELRPAVPALPLAPRLGFERVPGERAVGVRQVLPVEVLQVALVVPVAAVVEVPRAVAGCMHVVVLVPGGKLHAVRGAVNLCVFSHRVACTFLKLAF